MKLEYTAPEALITRFAVTDIITDSGVSSDDTTGSGLHDVDTNINADSYEDIFG